MVQDGEEARGNLAGWLSSWSDLGETPPPHPVKTPGSRKVDILSRPLLAFRPKASLYRLSGLPAACLLLAPS